MNSIRISTVAALLLISVTSLLVAQNPKPPTPLGIDRFPTVPMTEPMIDNVVLAIDPPTGNLTVLVDTTSCIECGNKLTTLEIKWDGSGPGFVEENCDFENIFTREWDVCTNTKIAKVATRGFGPVYSLGEVVPVGWGGMYPGDAAGTEWIVDGSYMIGLCLDAISAESPWVHPAVPVYRPP